MMLLKFRDLIVRYDKQEEILHSINGVSFPIEDGINYALSGEFLSGKSIRDLLWEDIVFIPQTALGILTGDAGRCPD